MNTQGNNPAAFARVPLPAKFCNLDRLLFAMRERDLDGIVASTGLNTFYLSGLNGIAHKADEPRPYAVIISRHCPQRAILVVADYYLSTVLAQPTWIEDVRSFRAVMLPLDLPVHADDVMRFVPQSAQTPTWMASMHASFTGSIADTIRSALRDLGLDKATVAFDELRLGHQLGLEKMQVRDGYDPMMYARSVKSNEELVLLRRATALNEQAINDAIHSWERGMSWREFNRAYHRAVTELGGFVRDPGAMVWGHPRGSDAAITLGSSFDDFELTQGTHVMFDCHGTLDLYCWDGGKTWIVDAEPRGDAITIAQATANAAQAVCEAMRPGMRVSQLQAIGREAFRSSGVANADQAIIFFHGLGLSHMDLEQFNARGEANVDWALEADMVVPLHVLYPGGEQQRTWVEEVVRVRDEGGEPFFSWGFEPIVGRGL
jgi:Xaa-Pro aminopeptidase